MKPTIRELSKLIGYSPATISNALNNKSGVNPDTVEKIVAAAKYYGYLETEAISKIRFVIYKHTGFLVEDISAINSLLDGVQGECKRAGIEMRMQYLERGAESFEQDIDDVLSDPSSAVLIVGSEIAKEDMYRFYSAKCPMVMLGNWNESVKGLGITVDYQDAAEKAVAYLAERGHRNIGYLKSRFRADSFESMERGYRKGLERYSLTYNPNWTLTFGEDEHGSHEKLIREYLRRYDLPTAFIADTDYVAFDAINALKKNWVNVPEQVSVIGCNDCSYADISSPRLTSFKIPYKDMGIMAVQQISEMMKKKTDMSLKILFQAELVERESVKKLI